MIEMVNDDGTVVKVQKHAVRTMLRRGFRRVRAEVEDDPPAPEVSFPADDTEVDTE